MADGERAGGGVDLGVVYARRHQAPAQGLERDLGDLVRVGQAAQLVGHVELRGEVAFSLLALADLLRQAPVQIDQLDPRFVLLGHVVAHDKHPAHAAGVLDRAVAVGPPHVRARAVPGHRHQLVDVPGRAPPLHDRLDLRADDGPDLAPACAPALSQRVRVSLGAHGGAVGVVVELDQVLAPPDEHRMVRGQHQTQGRFEHLGPLRGIAERPGAPVVGARQGAHLAAFGHEIKVGSGRPHRSGPSRAFGWIVVHDGHGAPSAA
nr:hypothetical protein [Massilia glaciei]